MPSLSNQSYFYGGGQVPNPSNVIQSVGAPNSKAGELGDIDVDPTNGNFYVKVSPTQWAQGGGVSGPIDSLTPDSGGAITPNSGTVGVKGTANQITTTGSGHNVTWSLPSAVITPGSLVSTTSLTATTTVTATLGNVTATNGNFVSSTAGKGLSFNANTATGAASGAVTLNSRAGQVVFTSVSIAAGADLTLTITNSEVTASTTQVIYSLAGVTTGGALSIKSVTNSAGSSAVVVTNGTGATTSTADIALTFLVVN